MFTLIIQIKDKGTVNVILNDSCLKDDMSDSQFVRRHVGFSVCKTACQILSL